MPPGSRLRCFNGAAARTRRRGTIGLHIFEDVGGLQWGRRANAAERTVQKEARP